MPSVDLEMHGDTELEIELDGYIGSAYNPQIDVSEIEGGHEVAITYKAPSGLTTDTFDVLDGERGPQGETGPQGPQGEPGVKGDKGDKGDTGATGAQGPKGDKGDKGDTGATGPQGPKGDTGATGATGPQGIQGPQGEQGPAGEDYVITSADYAAIAQQVESDIQPTIDAAEQATQDATAVAAEARAASAATWLSGNVLFGELAEGTVLIADDAFAAPPESVEVFGKSTQAGTPTPSSPVPILSVDALTLYASADGTTDYTNWPVQIPLSNNSARSLPDGTRDTVTLSYIGPSTEHEGWGVFGASLNQVAYEADLGDLTWVMSSRYGYFGSGNLTPATIAYGSQYVVPNAWCTAFTVRASAWVTSPQYAVDGSITTVNGNEIRVRDARFTDAASFKAGVSGVKMVYPLATPITHDLGEVELPILPNPLTAWADGGSAQPTLALEYERSLNIVIPRIEAAISDLATS